MTKLLRLVTKSRLIATNRTKLQHVPHRRLTLLLMGKTAMDKKSYLRQVPRIDLDETLFPPEKAAPQPEYTTSGCYDPKLRELAEMARSASAVAEDDEPKEN